MNLFRKLALNPHSSPFLAFYHLVCPRLVVTRRLFGIRCRININDHLQWVMLPETVCIEPTTYSMVNQHWGLVWDIGSNFGFYSLAAARAGNRVVAFDLSPAALRLLEASCRLNKLEVQRVAQPVTLNSKAYTQPRGSNCMARIQAGKGDFYSLSYEEAERRYGRPDLIKMDIEGGEREFLESQGFQNWLRENHISWLVEVHDREQHESLSRSGRFTTLDEHHLLLDHRERRGCRE